MQRPGAAFFFDSDMKWYWIKTNRLIKQLFSGFVWDIPGDKTVYLTFDDGPVPQVTEWVLDVLERHQIKATFFCIGNNIQNNPNIFLKIVNGGHMVANHTFDHVNGWISGNSIYFENIEKCENAIGQHIAEPAKLFRPPYGKITPSQAGWVRNRGYKIIMWDVLSADFDRSITPQQCLQHVIKNAANGSVIIFHDSIKAFPNLEYALPKAIEYLKKKGYRFGTIA